MIKDWKLFLESSNNDDDIESMKSELMKAFAPLFIAEVLMRPISDKSDLEDIANTILVSLLTGFSDAISNKDFLTDDVKLEIATEFSKYAQEGKEIMVDKSFKEGILYVFENFIKYMKSKSEDEEGEGWKKDIVNDEPTDELENLSKSEIEKLINDALDKGDFQEVEKLSKYLESNQYTDSPELKEMIDNVVTILVRVVDSIYA
jgi:hypothetical protein